LICKVDTNKVEENDCGQYISCRAPKSALNSLSVGIKYELEAEKENITVPLLDPDNVPTKLSNWEGNVRLEDSIQGMYEQIKKTRFADSGLFVD
jgi:short-subunit dehydrogenase